jgi:uncharacterized protein YecT (DUF1311 family)
MARMFPPGEYFAYRTLDMRWFACLFVAPLPVAERRRQAAMRGLACLSLVSLFNVALAGRSNESISAVGEQTVEIRREVSSVYAGGSAKVILGRGAKVGYFFATDSAEVTVDAGAEIDIMEFRGRRLTVGDGKFGSIAIIGEGEAHFHRLRFGDRQACSGIPVGAALVYTQAMRIHLYADVLAVNPGAIEGVWGDGTRFTLQLLQQASPKNSTCRRPTSPPSHLVVHELPGPSFDCAKAGSRAEEIVCSSPELSKMDKGLARAYQQARATAQEPRALVREQRRWLSERNSCADAACIKVAYEARVRTITASGMTNDKAKGICSTVVNAINDGTIRERFVAFERNSEVAKEETDKLSANNLSIGGVLRTRYKGKDHTFAVLYGGGSCGNCNIVDLHAKERISQPADDEDERLRWADWGNCDDLLWVDGEAVVVTGQFRDDYTRATLVSWFDAEGALRPLCYLNSTGEAETKILRNDNDGLCRGVLDGSGAEPAWVFMSIDQNSPNSSRYLARDGLVAAMDLDLDGKKDYIGQLSFDSGAGCGGHYEWFEHVVRPEADAPAAAENKEATDKVAEVDEDISGDYVIAKSPLSRWLRELPGGGVLAGVPGSPFKMRLLSHEGKPYVLTGGTSFTAQVASFWNGVAKTWCEYRVLSKHDVEVFYPIETWPGAAKETPERTQR